MKTIYLACGSGVASSGMAEHILKKKMDERKLVANVVVVGFRDLAARSKPDIMISIAPGLEKGKYADLGGVIVIQGVSLLTGIGIEKTMDEVEAAIKA
jgi:galactitol-specific phosphotransferase system IIB component